MKIVIEHLEAEMFPWCICEYSRVLADLKDRVLFTRVPLQDSSAHFATALGNNQFTDKSIAEVCADRSRVCLLDEQASLELSPEDCSDFDYCLVGGILGNVDELDADRTKELRTLGFPTRHLGTQQMTADTAAVVADMIVNQGKRLEEISFVDRPEFPIGPNESLILPFRLLKGPEGEAVIAEGIVDILIGEDGF